MGHLQHYAPRQRPVEQPWPRRRLRRWARAGDLVSSAVLFAVIPSLPRAELARLTERMIDRMDEIDGDPDREAIGEDDEPENDWCCAGDDGCGPVYVSGQLHWGSSDEEPGRIRPVYGPDQTELPINDWRNPCTAQQENNRD